MKRALPLLLALLACGKKTAAPQASVPATVAFVDVNVVPMDSERVLRHQTVLIDHDRIVALGPVESTGVPAAATKIDGKGKYLIPGLVDMHVHFNDESDRVLFAANGITTVRNMWGSPAQLEWRALGKKPDWFGPAIYTAGPIVDGKPPVWPGATELDTPEAAVAEVDAQKQAGYDFIKVYNRLTAPVYDAIVGEAKKQNIRVVGHVPDAVGVERALAGQTTIEHLDGYFRAAQDATSKAASLPHDEQRAELIAHLDPAKLPVLAKQTKDAGVVNVPTLVVLSRIGALDHPEQLAARPEMKYVDKATLARWDPKQDFRFQSMKPDDFALFRKGDALRGQLVKALHDSGAQVFAGTDTPNPFVVPGFSLHEELGLLVAAGFTPFEALRAATAAPAAWLDPAAKFGTVAIGTRADLVLLDRDPLDDIAQTTKIAGVMLRGTWYDRAALDGQLATLAKQRAAAPADPLASAPPLALDPKDGPTIFQASYTMKVGEMQLGRERFAVQQQGDRRVIVGQGASQMGLVTVREELVAGRITRMVVEAVGAKTSVSPEELHLPPETLIDANLLATMIPFADRARAGTAKITIKGKVVEPRGQLDDITYTFQPAKNGEIAFEVTSRLGTAPGTYAFDAAGFPTRAVVKAMGDLVITRD